MEFLKGVSLKARLHQDPPLSQSVACTILAEVAAALAAAHAQEIVHRDLKPDNIFLCESDGPPRKAAPASTNSDRRAAFPTL